MPLRERKHYILEAIVPLTKLSVSLGRSDGPIQLASELAQLVVKPEALAKMPIQWQYVQAFPALGPLYNPKTKQKQ
jgi:hypothetical protein